ncbi:eukaryotic translation initiation factor 5A-2-like [Pyrus ussuriensis x Pyrus communis]|uniref:Eukaryotic translation initiation factor 5A-2-like n=1 Tax=Pyrus ussuriensis x Pyrus communis TaxID=2448454 RepID=A0A5N5FIG9_9ROSA|nr:eukaryotic translation initiation factor 5A-2-like [Pyrus ussuriensis x Pyrus communis]
MASHSTTKLPPPSPFVNLLTKNGNTKDDLSLMKDLVVIVKSAMGEEQICALKVIGPKN